jgi:hypothetical protein
MSAPPDGYYFFLSYAHSAPLETAKGLGTERDGDAEPVVEAFYRDLHSEVGERVPGRADIGFLDQDLPLRSDLKAELGIALGRTQVLVPLYSPAYFARSWPLREQEAFRMRLRKADVIPESRIVPVLWTPMSPTEQRPDIARALGAAGAVPVYRENGLRALFLLRSHRSAYEAFRSWLADEIVAVAERAPLAPSAPLNLEEVEGSAVKEARFLVAMLDPGEIPARSDLWWHDYAAPVAQHVASVADRLGLRSEVTSVTEAEQRFDRTPGIVLVDPWPAGDRAESVAARLRDLPSWVLPVVLEEPRERLGEHAAAVQAAISGVKDAVKDRLVSASDMAQLEGLLPALVARARGRYLRQVQIDGISGSGRRPRLRDVTG